jgi:hypothetical protein
MEIKSFIGSSNVSEFHSALGQFMSYRYALEYPERKLHLAIPRTTHDTFFQRRFIASVIERNKIPLLVYDVQQEVITKWL